MKSDCEEKEYYVYVLQSQSNGRFYIVQTNNLTRRLVEHNQGKSAYTKNKGPWELVGNISCDTRSEAMRIEKKLKGMKNRDRVLSYIERTGDNIKV